MARRVTLIAVLIVVVIVTVLMLSPTDERTVEAEFANARGLLEGNEVRVQGAPVGSVEQIELTERGTALVTFTVDDAVGPLKSDALVAIRPVDLLGDIYLALSPGEGSEELRGAIPMDQASNAPRLNELLSVFREPERAGLQAVLVELGRALEERGPDLNQAIVALRPAIAASSDLMGEINAQNADLRSLIRDAERATGQLAGRSDDLEALVAGLAVTLRATAREAPALDAALERAPETLSQLAGTSGALERAARELRPLAERLGDAAPGLVTAAERLDPFLDKADPAIDRLHPLLNRLRSVLRQAGVTLPPLRRGLDSLDAATPKLQPALEIVRDAAPRVAEGFFVNFPDEAAELGKGEYPDAAGRHYWRGAGVVSCETFGVPIKPGCLFDALETFPGAPTRAAFGLNAGRPSEDERPGADSRRSRRPTGRVRSTGLPPTGEAIPKGSPESESAPHDQAKTLLDFLLGS